MIWKIFLIIDLCFHLVAIFEGKLLISSHENWIQIDVNSQTYLIVCHIRIITLYIKIYTKSKTISIIQTNHQRTFSIGRMCIENVFWCQICILDNYLSCEGEFLFFNYCSPLVFETLTKQYNIENYDGDDDTCDWEAMSRVQEKSINNTLATIATKTITLRVERLTFIYWMDR